MQALFLLLSITHVASFTLFRLTYFSTSLFHYLILPRSTYLLSPSSSFTRSLFPTPRSNRHFCKQLSTEINGDKRRSFMVSTHDQRIRSRTTGNGFRIWWSWKNIKIWKDNIRYSVCRDKRLSFMTVYLRINQEARCIQVFYDQVRYQTKIIQKTVRKNAVRAHLHQDWSWDAFMTLQYSLLQSDKIV